MTSIKTRLRQLTTAVPYGLETLLRLLDVEETRDIPTAAVPIGGRPRLLLNPDFVAAHCRTEEAFTMLILHELHHLLLGHTRLFQRVSWAHNVAFDAVINAMLCRQHPQARWTALFRECYRPDHFPYLFLRPPVGFPGPAQGIDQLKPKWRRVLDDLYYSNAGTFGDVFELLVAELQRAWEPGAGDPILLGNHDPDERGLDASDAPLLFDAVRRIVERWPQPPDPKVGRSIDSVLRETGVLPSPEPADRIFRRALLGAARAGRIAHGLPQPARMQAQQAWPTRDRRAFAGAAAGMTPLLYGTELPSRPRRAGICPVDVYIDVSGSCSGFIPYLLKGALSCRDLRPAFWLFSTTVVPASLQDLQRGKVRTTGGTHGAAVTAHLADRHSRAAVMLTDGYVGRVPDAHVQACKHARLQVVLTPGGWRRDLEHASSAFHQLETIR